MLTDKFKVKSGQSLRMPALLVLKSNYQNKYTQSRIIGQVC